MLNFFDGLTGHMSFLDWLPSLPDWGAGNDALSISAICSGAGAVILTKFTSNIGFVTMPINYCALFFGAMMSNWLFSGVDIPVDPDFQAPMVLAVAGMIVTALSLMMFMKEE